MILRALTLPRSYTIRMVKLMLTVFVVTFGINGTVGSLSAGGKGILKNDTSSGANGELSAKLVKDVNNGTLILNSDGTFSYTPDAGFHGVDDFTYTALEGHRGTNVATVNITVNPQQNNNPGGNPGAAPGWGWPPRLLRGDWPFRR